MADGKKYPWNKAKTDDPKAFEGVYAGPDFFANNAPPNNMQFMAVYAGPQMYNPPASPAAGAFLPDDVRFCARCGVGIKKTDRFCRECGAKQPE